MNNKGEGREGCSLPFKINLLFMFGCVQGTIRKVLHEVLLKIFQVFFIKPCILQTGKFILSKSFKSFSSTKKMIAIHMLLSSPVNPADLAAVPVFSAAAE